mmetsp:Transcript_3785/g.8191  ORF Transcript_3785/g.8191 Transcript_3785/m.8191 type:complete len:258 (+) Transcript_3785:153-926(+)
MAMCGGVGSGEGERRGFLDENVAGFGEGGPAGDAVEDHHPHRPEVGSHPNPSLVPHFGRHVQRAPAHRPGLDRRLDQLGQPEVDKLGFAVTRHHRVGGLDVAVQEAVLVRVREPCQALGDDVHCLRCSQAASLLDHRGEGMSLDELHDDGERWGVDDVVDDEDIRVRLQPRNQLRLLQEGRLALGGDVAEHFDCHPPCEARVIGEEDLAEAALADAAAEVVAGRHQGCVERLDCPLVLLVLLVPIIFRYYQSAFSGA